MCFFFSFLCLPLLYIRILFQWRFYADGLTAPHLRLWSDITESVVTMNMNEDVGTELPFVLTAAWVR